MIPPPYAACPLDAFPEAKRVHFGGPGGATALQGPATWTKENLYLVDSTLRIDGALTITAGTTVCIAHGVADSSGFIDVAGSLDVQGTSDAPVVLTSIDPKEYWDFINLVDGAAVSLHHVQIHHAARRTSDSAITATGASHTLLLDDVVFVGGGDGRALTAAGGTALAAELDLWVASVAGSPTVPAVLVSVDTASGLTNKVRMSADLPVEARAVEIESADPLTDSVTLPKLEVPYAISSTLLIRGDAGQPTPVLTLTPGTTVKLGRGAAILVGTIEGPGGLLAVGTPDERITFTALASEPDPEGEWEYIRFGLPLGQTSFDPSTSRLSYVDISHGGRDPYVDVANCHDPAPEGAGSGMVAISGSGDYQGPAIDHVSFAHSASDAIRSNDGYSAHLLTDYLDPTLGNTFTDIAGQNAWPTTPCP